MFDFFRQRTAKDFLDEAKEKYTVPNEIKLDPEKSPTVCYRIGVTEDNRISLQMGYTEITMTRAGVENLIRQLSVFRDQLPAEDNNGIDPE